MNDQLLPLLQLIREVEKRPSRAAMRRFLSAAGTAMPQLNRAERQEIATAFREVTGWSLSFAATEPQA